MSGAVDRFCDVLSVGIFLIMYEGVECKHVHASMFWPVLMIVALLNIL